MPHQCLNCEEIYENTSDVIIKGCPNCGRKLFLFIKKLPSQNESIELTKEEKDNVLAEIENLVPSGELDQPIILKLENVRILSPGKYEIDINQLLKRNKPLVYRIQDGTYVIDFDFLRVNKDD